MDHLPSIYSVLEAVVHRAQALQAFLYPPGNEGSFPTVL
jgi:hypothetical protein